MGIYVLGEALIFAKKSRAHKYLRDCFCELNGKKFGFICN